MMKDYWKTYRVEYEYRGKSYLTVWFGMSALQVQESFHARYPWVTVLAIVEETY